MTPLGGFGASQALSTDYLSTPTPPPAWRHKQQRQGFIRLVKQLSVGADASVLIFFASPLAESVAHLDQVFAEPVLLRPLTRHDNTVVIASNQCLPHRLCRHVQLPWLARWQLRVAFRTLKRALSHHRASEQRWSRNAR